MLKARADVGVNTRQYMEVLSIQAHPGALQDIGDYTKTTWVPTLLGNKGILRNSRKQHQAFTKTHKVILRQRSLLS